MVHYNNIRSVRPIIGMSNMTSGKEARDYSDYGLEVRCHGAMLKCFTLRLQPVNPCVLVQLMTQADRTGAAKDKDKTFYLACPTKQARDEWIVVFSTLLRMTPAERKRFQLNGEPQ
eukprot:SAG31_NODE_4830_length_2920_cov_1.951436_2_plen_116_part_00